MSTPKPFPKPVAALRALRGGKADPPRPDPRAEPRDEISGEITQPISTEDLPEGPPTDRVQVPGELRAPRYAPPPGEKFDLFTVNELKAKEVLQELFKPVTTAFIILRGSAEELIPDARGSMQVIRELEAGDMVNASLFAPGVDARGAETEVRAVTDMLFYIVTLDDVEAYDVSEEKRASVRRKRERCVQNALSRACIQLLKNRNGVFTHVEETRLMAEGAAIAAANDSEARETAEAEVRQLLERIQILEKALLERMDELKERVLRPIIADRDERVALLSLWLEGAFEQFPKLQQESERLYRDNERLRQENERHVIDREADLASMHISLEPLKKMLEEGILQEEDLRLAALIGVVSKTLELMAHSDNPDHAQAAFKALTELHLFKMGPPKLPKKEDAPAT